jgi:hypothetical protein
VIGGPGDPTDRFAYWPARAAIAGDGPMLVPGGATAAVQVIDVRDLVAWMLDASEDGVTGPVNAVGESVSLDDVVATARSVADASGPVVRADAEWLAAQEVRPWSGPDSLPLWIPDDGGPARLGASDGGRYLATGGHRRPIADTARDVLAEERVLGLDRDRRGGLTRERELELIAELNS